MEKEILDFLKKIENEELKIIIKSSFLSTGNICYNVENGWQITIFNDADHWDYIDNIKTNDGRLFDFEYLDKFLNIRNYCPSKEISFKIYKIENI